MGLGLSILLQGNVQADLGRNTEVQGDIVREFSTISITTWIVWNTYAMELLDFFSSRASSKNFGEISEPASKTFCI